MAYNAKTLPLGQDPRFAAANYGINTENAADKFRKIWADRATEDGGSKQIYNKMMQWASPESLEERGQNPDSQQWRLMRQALNTGKIDPKLKPELIETALGLGLTETARYQQHKPQSFLSKFGGSLLTAGLGFIPVVGPYAAAAAGGYFGQRNGGGVLGGLLGAAGGYLGGKAVMNAGGASGIYNSAKNGISNFFSPGGFSNPAALGITGNSIAPNFASMPGAFPAVASGATQGAAALGNMGSVGLNFASGAMPGTVASNLGSINNVAAGVGRGLAEGGITADSLYTPRSAGPMPSSSFLEKAARGARAAGRIADAVEAFSPPAQPMAMPMMGRSPPSVMSAHGAIMRPLLPYDYPDNPFMTRIV